MSPTGTCFLTPAQRAGGSGSPPTPLLSSRAAPRAPLAASGSSAPSCTPSTPPPSASAPASGTAPSSRSAGGRRRASGLGMVLKRSAEFARSQLRCYHPSLTLPVILVVPPLSSSLSPPPPSMPCPHHQEFRDFDRVKVDGTATLFLHSHVPTISMRNHTVRVSRARASYWDRLGGTGAAGHSSPDQALLGLASSPWTWTRS